MLPEHNIAEAVTLAAGDRRLGKAFRWTERKKIPNFKEGDYLPFEISGLNGRWVDDGNTAQQKHYNYIECHIADLAGRLELRQQLNANPNMALVMGALADPYRGQLEQIGPLWQLPGAHLRNKRVLVDAPRSFMVLDVDKISLADHGDNVFELDDDLPSILHDMFDAAGLDWLICNAVMQLSSSHGLYDPQLMGAHLDYHLSQPLTIAEQKCVASYINDAARAAKLVPEGKDFVDLKIYESSRLLFTAAPELRVYVDSERSSGVAHCRPPAQRVRAVNKGQPYLEVPSGALEGVKRAARLANLAAISRAGDSRARLMGRRAAAAAGAGRGANKLAPGNVHSAANSRIYATVQNTPVHRLPEAKQRLSAQLVAEVMDMHDGDAAKLETRLRVASGDEFERSWNGALNARGGSIIMGLGAQLKSGASVEAARNGLTAAIAAAMREGVEYAHTEQDGMIKQPPTHVLIDVPPGIGKTHAALASVKTEHLMGERIAYLTPRVSLSAEAARRMRARLPKDEYTQSRVRHHIGRGDVCEEPHYNRLAEGVEKLGLSPLKPVCFQCPRKDACPWPQQAGDKESGLVFGQHAHAITSMARIRDMHAENAPSVGVIDETMLSTLVRQSFPAYKIANLAKLARRAKGRSIYATADLLHYRSLLVGALAQSTGLLNTDLLMEFRRQVTVTVDGVAKTRPAIVWAAIGEREAMRAYSDELHDALKAYHDAHMSRANKRPAERRIAKATTQLRLIQWFAQMYRAIEGSLGVEGRKHVFGVRVKNGRVSLTIRAELPAVMKQRNWIWLDGTADVDVWRAFLPKDVRASVIKIKAAEGPYRLYQYLDRPYGKRMFATKSEDSRAHLAKLSRFIRHKASTCKKVLLVAQKEIKDALLPQLPGNVAAIHFNDQRGRDDFKDYDCAIIVGRPMPNTAALELLTEALHFDDEACPSLLTAENKKNRAPLRLKLSQQREIEILAETHPDRRVAAMQRQIADSEVKQAVHRLRLFDRTEANPAEIHVFGQVDTGLVITEARKWIDAEIDDADGLLAGGFICAAPEVLPKLLPDMSRASAFRVIDAALKRGADRWPEKRARVAGVNGLLKVRVRENVGADAISAALGLQITF